MERIDVLLDPIKAALIQIAHFLPRLAIAMIVLLIGWLLARGVRFAVIKGLRAANFPVLTERAGLDPFLREGGITIDTTMILATLVSWVVLVAALVIAFNGLDLGYATDLRSMTQGRASYSMEFDHYEPLPASLAEELVQKARR